MEIKLLITVTFLLAAEPLPTAMLAERHNQSGFLSMPEDYEDPVSMMDNMAVDLDDWILAEEEKRLRGILLDGYKHPSEYMALCDSSKAKLVDEVFQSLDKTEQHAIRHHSYILVQDILFSL